MAPHGKRSAYAIGVRFAVPRSAAKAANDKRPSKRGRPPVKPEAREAARYLFIAFCRSKEGRGLADKKDARAKRFVSRYKNKLDALGVKVSDYRSLLNFLKRVRVERTGAWKARRRFRLEVARRTLRGQAGFIFNRSNGA